jgi:hypothetical protein
LTGVRLKAFPWSLCRGVCIVRSLYQYDKPDTMLEVLSVRWLGFSTDRSMNACIACQRHSRFLGKSYFEPQPALLILELASVQDFEEPVSWTMSCYGKIQRLGRIPRLQMGLNQQSKAWRWWRRGPQRGEWTPLRGPSGWCGWWKECGVRFGSSPKKMLAQVE